MNRHQRRGQSSVEFALAFPFMALALLGFVDLGRAVGAWVSLSEAAREGARSAIYVDSTDAQIRAAAKGHPGMLGTINDGQITITPGSGRTSGTTVRVTISYDFPPITPYIGAIPLHASASKVIE